MNSSVNRIEPALVDWLLSTVSKVMNIGKEQLLERRRYPGHVFARCLIWDNLRDKGYSFSEIGNATGYDHSTVMHGVTWLRNILYNPTYANESVIYINFQKELQHEQISEQEVQQ